jgi:hypothetical protein
MAARVDLQPGLLSLFEEDFQQQIGVFSSALICCGRHVEIDAPIPIHNLRGQSTYSYIQECGSPRDQRPISRPYATFRLLLQEYRYSLIDSVHLISL